MNKYTIEVIICCTDYSVKLLNALNALSKLDILNYQLLVRIIQNGSQNSFLKLIPKFENLDIHFDKIYKSGKGYAIEHAITKFNSDFFLIVDDDNYLERNYINIAINLFIKHPNIGAVGGKSLLYSNGNKLEISNKYLALGTQHPKSNVHVNYLWGAGLMINGDVIRVLKNVNFRFVTSNFQKAVGDDSEINHIIQFLGMYKFYSDDLLLYHDISNNRLNDKNNSIYYIACAKSITELYGIIFYKNLLNVFIIYLKSLYRIIFSKCDSYYDYTKNSYRIKHTFKYLKSIYEIYCLKFKLNKWILESK